MLQLRWPRFFAIGLSCLLFASCATQQPLSSVDRTKYRTVTVNPAI